MRARPSPLWILICGPMLLLGLAALLPQPPGIPYLGALDGGLDVVLLVAGAAGLGWKALAVEELLFSPREVHRRLLIGGLTFAESTLPSGEIEEVVVAPLRGARGTCRVLAVADIGTVSFGMMLSRAQRRWVRDCIIAVISK